jgi:hypothetical protein
MTAPETETAAVGSAVPAAAALAVLAADIVGQKIEFVAAGGDAGIAEQGTVVAVAAFADDIAEPVPEDELAAAGAGIAEFEFAAELVVELGLEPAGEFVDEYVNRPGGGLVGKAVAGPVYKTVAEPVDEVAAEPVDEVAAEPVDGVAAGPVDEVAAGRVDEVAAGPVDEAAAGLVAALVAAVHVVAAPVVAHTYSA